MEHSYLKMNVNTFSFPTNLFHPIFSCLMQVRCLEVMCTSSSHFTSDSQPSLWCCLLNAAHSALYSLPPCMALVAAGFISCLDFSKSPNYSPCLQSDLLQFMVLSGAQVLLFFFFFSLYYLLKTLPWLIIVSEIASTFLNRQPSPFIFCPCCLSRLLHHSLLHPLLQTI